MIHPDVCRRFEARVASLEAAIRNHHLAWNPSTTQAVNEVLWSALGGEGGENQSKS
jgi:hypothetical protein